MAASASRRWRRVATKHASTSPASRRRAWPKPSSPTGSRASTSSSPPPPSPGRASAFVRGGESRFACVLIDGVPVNQPGGAYDFGTALPFELERVEVVRGAASALYGTDALAGVVHIMSRRGRPRSEEHT